MTDKQATKFILQLIFWGIIGYLVYGKFGSSGALVVVAIYVLLALIGLSK